MDGITSGIIVGAALIILNVVKDILKAKHDKKVAKSDGTRSQVQDHDQRIDTLERHTKETHELAKCTLAMCVILGDGMVQSGINSDVKKAFNDKKQDALKML